MIVERSNRISKGEVNLIPKLPTGQEYLELYGPSFEPEKPMLYHIDPKNLFTKGYVADNPVHPRVVIPVKGWKQRHK